MTLMHHMMDASSHWDFNIWMTMTMWQKWLCWNVPSKTLIDTETHGMPNAHCDDVLQQWWHSMFPWNHLLPILALWHFMCTVCSAQSHWLFVACGIIWHCSLKITLCQWFDSGVKSLRPITGGLLVFVWGFPKFSTTHAVQCALNQDVWSEVMTLTTCDSMKKLVFQLCGQLAFDI